MSFTISDLDTEFDDYKIALAHVKVDEYKVVKDSNLCHVKYSIYKNREDFDTSRSPYKVLYHTFIQLNPSEGDVYSELRNLYSSSYLCEDVL